MASLYEIQQELINVFDTIEDNGGEITEEQIKLLDIKESELKDKLYKYYQAIKIWDSNAVECKTEKKRINDVQKKYENRVAKLKEIILNTVEQFGDTGKTNKFIELPTVRFSTRNSNSIEVDTDRVGLLCSHVSELIGELYTNGVIYTGEDVDLQGIINSVNAICVAEYGETFELYKVEDLESLTVEVTTKDTIANFFRKHNYALNQLGSDPIFSEMIANNIDKTELKSKIKFYNIAGNPITIAKEVNNTSLIIK